MTAVTRVRAIIYLISFTSVSCITISDPNSSMHDNDVMNLLSDNDDAIVYNCSRYTVEHDYSLLDNGSLLLPDSGAIRDREAFFVVNGTAYLCADSDSSTEMAYDFSEEFLGCAHVLLDRTEYELRANGSLYVGVYDRAYRPRDYFVVEGGAYVCQPPFEEMQQNMSGSATPTHVLNKFSDAFSYVTYAGLSLSILCLFAHLAVFCLVPSVRNLPGCCLASLSLSLLLAYFCFLTVSVATTTEECSALGVSIYYFFLSSFFWMNSISFDVWRSFRVVMKELRISSHKVPRRRFLLYSAYSWLVPGALAVLVKVFDSTDVLPRDLRPSFGDPVCWFGQRKALLVFFAAPLIAVMVVNGAFFLDVAVLINRHTLKSSHSHDVTLKKRFFMFMRLALIMGLTWIVGLVAGYADNEPMWYLFIVLNTLQGLFIFVVFSCSSKVRHLVFNRRRQRTQRGSSSVRTISQAI